MARLWYHLSSRETQSITVFALHLCLVSILYAILISSYLVLWTDVQTCPQHSFSLPNVVVLSTLTQNLVHHPNSSKINALDPD